MESLFYNLQNIIINLKKLKNNFINNKITDFHYDLAKLYIYYHKDIKLIDINNKIDLILEDIVSLKPINKYYPKIYNDYIECKKLLNMNCKLMIIYPIYYNDNILIDNIIYKKEFNFDGILQFNLFLKELYPNEGFLVDKANRYYCEKPVKLYLVDNVLKEYEKKYNIIKNIKIIKNILKAVLHNKAFKDEPELRSSMKYELELHDKEDTCFAIVNNRLEYINIDKSSNISYYKRKNIIYNPEEFYYFNGYKYIRNTKTVKELIELFDNNCRN